MELWMHLGGLLSTQEARVARGDLTLEKHDKTGRIRAKRRKTQKNKKNQEKT